MGRAVSYAPMPCVQRKLGECGSGPRGFLRGKDGVRDMAQRLAALKGSHSSSLSPTFSPAYRAHVLFVQCSVCLNGCWIKTYIVGCLNFVVFLYYVLDFVLIFNEVTCSSI